MTTPAPWVENEQLLGKGAIPSSERWRRDLLSRWRGAEAIIIQHCRHPEKKSGFTKIQRLKLQKVARSPLPLQDVDETLEVIAESIYGWLHDAAEEGKIEPDEQVTFAVEVQRTVSKDSGPARQKWWLTASLEGVEEDPYDSFEQEALSELERQRNAHIENLQRANDHQTLHIENLHETLIKLATISNAPMKEVTGMLHMASNIATSGMQSSLNAAAMQYSVEAKKAEEEGKARRTEMWMSGVGQHVLPFIPAAVSALLSKLTGGGAVPGPPKPGGEPQEEGDPQEKWDAYWRERFAVLRTSLTAEQEQLLEDLLTSTERSLLRQLLASETFISAMSVYSDLLEAVDLESLKDHLEEAFTSEQQAILFQFHIAVAEWMKANEEEQAQAEKEAEA